jgi:predicted nucleotidyltransferase
MAARIQLDPDAVKRLCQKWGILRMELFGSVLTEEFSGHSDVDVMVTFAPDVHFDLPSYQELQCDLADLFGRRVDLVTRRAVERDRNPHRRKAILAAAEELYAA